MPAGSTGRNTNAPQPNYGFDKPEDITFAMLFHRLLGGLKLLWIALKYRALKLMGISNSKNKSSWKVPAFKLSLLAIVIILVTQKDIRFSVNLKAPLASLGQSHEPEAIATSNKSLGKFSLGDALPFGKEAVKSEEVVKVSDLNPEDVNDYIGRFSKVAVAEMRKFGIPASIKMAQAILESKAGESAGVKQYNNHFGSPLGQTEYVSAWENWRAHSLFLKNECSALFDDAYGYKQWAKGLQKLKYSTDRNYADKLIEVIEKFELTLLDE
jgi:flagellum-specific peptidoglycan hydrolase FlgJ